MLKEAHRAFQQSFRESSLFSYIDTSECLFQNGEVSLFVLTLTLILIKS